MKASKLQQRIINMDNMAAEGQGAFEKADVVFCTLGTTRSKAGSAEEFVRVSFPSRVHWDSGPTDRPWIGHQSNSLRHIAWTWPSGLISRR
jgi:hypothetical protein